MTTLGIQRESLLNNPLLQKTELGRPLKHGFTLPPDGFTYGRPNLYIGSGAAEALCSWNIVKPRVVTKQPEERDFVRLNKMAVQAGLTSAPEQYQFRATHDVKVSSASKDRSLNKLKRIPPSMVFGVPTRPSTPVYDLLAHKYQDKWIEEKRKAEEAIRAKQDQKKRVGRDIYETRASLLRKHEPHVDTEPLWHMKKFERVSPRLETFRTGEAKKQAFKHHESDSTSRKGVFGHGLYETAKT